MARKPKKAAPVRRSHKNAPQAKPTILQIIKGLRKANAELGKDFADLQGNYIKLDGEHGKLAAELGRERSEVELLQRRLNSYLREIGELRSAERRTSSVVRHLSQFIVDRGHPPEVHTGTTDLYEEVARERFSTRPGAVNYGYRGGSDVMASTREIPGVKSA